MDMSLRTFALLGLAGALGAVARYVAAGMLNTFVDTAFPWGIFTVNVLGCLIFGLIWELAAVRGLFSDATRTILLTGFVGSFTTFSTLVFDLHAMMQIGQWRALTLHLCGQLLLGLAALRLGMLLARTL